MMTTMRMRLPALAVAAMVALGACSNDPASPDDASLLGTEYYDLVPDYAISSAAVIDGGGIGGSRLPAELQLSDEQKAEIAALHDAFRTANATEIEALREIERQLRELRRNRELREQARALLEEARAIRESLDDEFDALQEAIWDVYTDEQRAWIEEHRPKVCRPGERPELTEEQIAAIRALHQAFQAEMADEIAAIKAAHQAARAAHQAGATREEIQAILAEVADEIAALREAEQRLHQAIQDILTDEQKENWCVVRRHVAPGRG